MKILVRGPEGLTPRVELVTLIGSTVPPCPDCDSVLVFDYDPDTPGHDDRQLSADRLAGWQYWLLHSDPCRWTGA